MDYKLEGCGGCQTCEIACSFKQTGEFNHQRASIEILEDKEKSGFIVRLNENLASGRIPCNGCIDIEGEPICTRYCHKCEELKIIIQQFINKNL